MHVVGAGRCEKQSLGFRAPARIIPLKKQVTNGLGAPTPSGLTRDEAADSAVLKNRSECLDLRGLADPFPALEADKASA